MAQHTFSLPIAIDGTKEMTWEVLTNFKNYPEWNSILRMSENDYLEVGRKFRVVINDGGKESKFKATLLSKKDFCFFSAQQKILGKWFFSATHHFVVETDGGQTRFVQRWDLTGLVSKLFKRQIHKQLASFHRMNLELKALLEQSNHHEK